MKVLMINVVCGIKSTGRICTDLADELVKNGHEVKIAYGRDIVPMNYEKYAVQIGTNRSVKLHVAKARLLDAAGWGSKKATQLFIKWVEQYNPDIIHLHNIHGYYINIKLLFEYLKMSGKPVIWTLHDCWGMTGHCAHFSVANCDQWKNGCNKCKQIREYPKAFIDRSSRNWKLKKQYFTLLDKITLVTPSNWLKNVVKESFLGKYEVMTIPNGVDLSVFQPCRSCFRKNYDIENKIILLGCATAWSEKKGLHEFIDLSKVLDDSYVVVLVGLNDEQLKELPDSIIGLPKTNSVNELAEIYSAADIFINVSKEETMGLTTVEAMACNTPVVVSDLTAVPEVVRPYGGIVVKSLNTSELVNAIHIILANNYEPRKNAFEYEKNKQYSMYIDTYNKIFEERNCEN